MVSLSVLSRVEAVPRLPHEARRRSDGRRDAVDASSSSDAAARASLSIVLGTQQTTHFRPLLDISASILQAPFMVPSPPITNNIFTPFSINASQIFDVSWPPRDDRNTVPPLR